MTNETVFCFSVVHRKTPDIFSKYLYAAINGGKAEILEYYFTISYQNTLEAVRNVPELQKFVDKLENFNTFERQKNVFTRHSDEEFHVLNHGEFGMGHCITAVLQMNLFSGDMWINNIFFKTNENNETVDCRLVIKLKIHNFFQINFISNFRSTSRRVSGDHQVLTSITFYTLAAMLMFTKIT